MSQHFLWSQRICMFVRMSTNLSQSPCCCTFDQIIRNLYQWLLQNLNSFCIDNRRCWLLIVCSNITQCNNPWKSINIFIFIQELNHSSNSTTLHKDLSQLRWLFCDLSDNSSSHFSDSFIYVFKFIKNFREEFCANNSLCQLRRMFCYWG